MSVLHLLGTAGEGGAETYFVDLVAALAGAGVAQSAALRANPRRQAALQAAGVPARVLRFGGPLDLLTTPLTARFARRTGTRLALAWMNRAARHAPKGPWARVGRLGGYYNLKYYRGFKNKGQLDFHERVHLGEKPFKCDHCSEGFETATKLTRHITVSHMQD